MKKSLFFLPLFAVVIICNCNKVQAESIEEHCFTTEEMNEIVKHVPADVVHEVTAQLGSATCNEYVSAFVEADTELSAMLYEKYNIAVKGERK